MRYPLFSLVVGSASAVLLLLSSVSPAAAEDIPEAAGDTVSFGVFAQGQEAPEGGFDIAELSELGVADGDLEQLASGVVPEPGEEAWEAEPRADDVLTRWGDVDGESVIWRQGHYDPNTGRGSGAEKIDQKHNLSMEAVRATTRWPFTEASLPDNTKERESPTGTSYRYRAEVWEVECTGWLWWRECNILDTRIVRALVDYRVPSHSTEPMGAFNAYCEQNTGDRCPDWVRDAMNV